MRMGDGRHSRLYRNFADAVRQAQAQARVQAEMKALQEQPVTWLKQGPGKETPDSPGWSATVKPSVTNDNRQFNVLLDPSMQGLFSSLLQVLAPYPEARAAVALALSGPGEVRQSHPLVVLRAMKKPRTRT
jgi:hypothetical protein